MEASIAVEACIYLRQGSIWQKLFYVQVVAFYQRGKKGNVYFRVGHLFLGRHLLGVLYLKGKKKKLFGGRHCLFEGGIIAVVFN